MIDGTPLLRAYAGRRLRRLSRMDPLQEQRHQLRRLLRAAADTRFGRDHEFARLREVADFQAAVPLRRYEDMWADYWGGAFPRLENRSWPGTIPFFALSSGTSSGTTKYIPCSREMVRTNRRAALDLLVHHLANRPASRLLGGKNMMLGGSTDLAETAPGIRSGDLSGIAAAQIPWWAKAYTFPPRELALIADWERKIERISRAAVAEDIRAISGTPSWLLVFFERAFAQRDPPARHLAEIFPNLELLAHGGVSFAPYRRQFETLLEGGHAETREVYAASEGFVAVADAGPADGMRLMLDNGLFLEFVPVEEVRAARPVRHWLGNAEPGIDYALALSTCAGLWAYLLGDIVRLVSLHPPRLVVTGRISYFLSAFGEHLTGEEIESAVAEAAAAIGAHVVDFAAGAIVPDAIGALGRHLFVVEFAEGAPEPALLGAFARRIDAELSRANDDYRAHRAHGFGLDAPEIRVAPPGAFAAWMKSRGKLGGQHKVPRVIDDRVLLDQLCRFVAERAGTAPA